MISEGSPARSFALSSLLLVVLIWSYSWIVMKSVVPYIGPFEFSALRSVLGALLLFVVLKARGHNIRMPPLAPTLAIGALQTAGMVGFAQWALMVSGVGKVAIIAYTMPFWVVLLSVWFLGEKLTPLRYGVLGIAAIGLLLVIQPWQLTGSLLGSLLALLSGLSWGASAVVAKKMYSRHHVDMLSMVMVQMAFGAAILSVIAVLANEPPITWAPYLFVALGYTSILATGFAWALWLYILRSLPASVASLSMLGVPVLGVLLSWWLLGEQPTLTEGAGIILILLALSILSFYRKRQGTKTPAD